MFELLKFITFILVTVGCTYFIQKVTKIDYFYIPITTISLITLIVYYCGLIQHLQLSFFVVSVIGVIGWILLYKDRKNWKKASKLITYFNFFFILVFLFFMGDLLTTRFQHYDNYSHWATVVKYILLNQNFPNATSKIIEFTNYPLGTASWIYYVCSFLGHQDGIMLIAQGLIIFGAFYAMFGIIEEKKRFLLYAFMGLGLSLLSIINITIRMNNLLVDFLLPILSLACISLIYRYRNKIKKTIFPLILILGLLTIIKSTGVIFATFAICYFVYILLKLNKDKIITKITYLFTVILGSLIPYIAWTIYQKIVFAGVTSKFDLTNEQIQTIVAGKTQQQIQEIMQLFIKEVCNVQTRAALIFLLFEVGSIVAYILVRIVLKKKWKLGIALIALNVMTFIYYMGILAMYIYSMPVDEALYLAGFERYASSIIAMFSGAIILCATIDVQDCFYMKIGDKANYKSFKSIETKKYYQMSIVGFVVVCLLIIISEYNGMKYNDTQIPTSTLVRVEKVTGNRWPTDGKIDENRYLLYGSD